MVSYPDKLKQSDMGSNIIVLLYDQPLNLKMVVRSVVHLKETGVTLSKRSR